MVSGIITIALVVLFVGGWIWLWRPAHRQTFDSAARIPLHDDESPRQADAADAHGTDAQGIGATTTVDNGEPRR